MNKTIKLEIPFFSQLSWLEESQKDWWRKICWLACIKMTIAYFNWDSPKFNELLKYRNNKYEFFDLNSWEEKSYNYYIKWTWWLHYGLSSILRDYKLFSSCERIEKNKVVDYIQKNISENKVVIASVNLWFDNKQNIGWHLVVITWLKQIDWKFQIIINDPIDESWDTLIEEELFINNFSWSIIIVSNKIEEKFIVNSPINIETKENNSWVKINFELFHIHESESLAVKKWLEYIKKYWWKIHYITQNKERFIRYSVVNDNWNNIFLRVDPNRIFDDFWLQKTITERNSHLDKKYLNDAIKKWQNLRNYILRKINPRENTHYICIHNNKLLNINDFEETSDKLYINPVLWNNAFIVAPNKYYFEKIKSAWISVVYFDNEDDSSLRDYLQKNKFSAFTIESAYEDSKTFEYLLDTLIRKIL